MKFLAIIALVLSTATAFDLRNVEIKQRNVVVPAIEAEGRITNGQDAAVGQFPYQVGISLIYEEGTSWCGGSLIGPNWVLTAAHCIDEVQSVIVYLGATIRTEAEVTYKVPKSDIIVHPDWNPLTVKNDISLIKIPPVTYSAKIQPIELPAISSSYSSYVGDKVIASGWGDTYGGNDDNHLQWARLQVIGNSACKKQYDSFFTPSNICVSTPGGVSTCQGDSGGPLVVESSGIQIGVTSYGPPSGCVAGDPVVFTRLTSYLKWIKANTGISY